MWRLFLFGSLSAAASAVVVAAPATQASRRLAESCTADDVLARSEQVQTACCQGLSDCSGGWPTACDSQCAPLYLSFFEECHEQIRDLAGGTQGAHQGLMNYDAFRDSCFAGLATPTSICGRPLGAPAITQPRGTLVDGAGDNYHTNFDCHVLLQAPVGERVVLKFTQFSLDPGLGPADPSQNFVRLYDGPDANAPEITWISGLDVDALAWTSRSNQMFVHFTANFQANPHAFTALWVFSGSGATCSLHDNGDLLQGDTGTLSQLPAHANLGTCDDVLVIGRGDGFMDSGKSCTLACDPGFGIVGQLASDEQGDVAPTYGFLLDMVVCFDGTLEMHPFTCERQQKNKVNICAPPEASLIAGSGKLVDGSGGASGTDGQVATNQDCGVKLEATPLQIVAVKFSSFDVSSSDRVDLHDGKDANAPIIASLFGDFTCAEDSTDCDDPSSGQEIEGGEPLSAAMVGGYASTGSSLFVHFVTRRMNHATQAMESEGFTLEWLHSDTGAACHLDQPHQRVQPPAFGNKGDCTVASYPGGISTGTTCTVGCDPGLRSSAEVNADLWRTIHALGPAISAQPLCWDGRMINVGSITCLQSETCYNYPLGDTPTLNSACIIYPNTAPFPGQMMKQSDCATAACDDESLQGVGDNVWYQLAVEIGKTYTLETRLGSATFTWLYIIDTDGSTELANCVYCRSDDDDYSSLLQWTADGTKTVFIKIHGEAFLGHGFTLTVDCPNCSPPPLSPGVPQDQCIPLPDPDGEAGGVDTSQCRGIRQGDACTVTCDADKGFTGGSTDYQCGTSGTILNQWTALDGGFPSCSRAPPPPPGNGVSAGIAPSVIPATPVVTIVAVDPVASLQGYTTYQLSLNIDWRQIGTVYAVFGAPADGSTPAAPMQLPPAFQTPAPFGATVGGNDPQFWNYDETARYDSWLTVGSTDASAFNANQLSSVGLDASAWTETTGLFVDNGAVFWMDPNADAPARGHVVLAQLTVATATLWTATMNVQGHWSVETCAACDGWKAIGLSFSSSMATTPGGGH